MIEIKNAHCIGYFDTIDWLLCNLNVLKLFLKTSMIIDLLSIYFYFQHHEPSFVDYVVKSWRSLTINN